jgi:hypothetical protein
MFVISTPHLDQSFLCTQTPELGFYMLGSEPLDTKLVPRENAFAVPIDQPNTDTFFDINIHEMEAINYALKSWGSIWASSTVLVFMDNQTFELGGLRCP